MSTSGRARTRSLRARAQFVDAAGRVEKFQRKFAGNYFKNKKK
jgi:hypothetical protein